MAVPQISLVTVARYFLRVTVLAFNYIRAMG